MKRIMILMYFLLLVVAPLGFVIWSVYMALRCAAAGQGFPMVMLAVSAYIGLRYCVKPAGDELLEYLRRKEGDTEL